MEKLSIINTETTMTSNEIAELTGKRHDHVMRDIKKQLESLNIGLPKFGGTYQNVQGKEFPCFKLDYEQTMILISGYSVELRSKVISRWMQLEQENKPQLPQSFSEALQLAADQAKQLELQAPKVEFYEKVLESNSSFTTSQIADELDITAQKLNKILKVENVIYKQSNEYHLYSKYKGKGYANIRTAPYKDSKGVVKTSHYLVWTEKGREFIHSIVSELSI